MLNKPCATPRKGDALSCATCFEARPDNLWCRHYACRLRGCQGRKTYHALMILVLAQVWAEGAVRSAEGTFSGRFGCPPGIRTPILCSRGRCPTIERGGRRRIVQRNWSAVSDSMGCNADGQESRIVAEMSSAIKQHSRTSRFPPHSQGPSRTLLDLSGDACPPCTREAIYHLSLPGRRNYGRIT